LDFGLGGVAAKTFNSVSRFGEGAVNSAVADSQIMLELLFFLDLNKQKFSAHHSLIGGLKNVLHVIQLKMLSGTAELVSENFGMEKLHRNLTSSFLLSHVLLRM
jgi:hypothetical protein